MVNGDHTKALSASMVSEVAQRNSLYERIDREATQPFKDLDERDALQLYVLHLCQVISHRHKTHPATLVVLVDIPLFDLSAFSKGKNAC